MGAKTRPFFLPVVMLGSLLLAGCGDQATMHHVQNDPGGGSVGGGPGGGASDNSGAVPNETGTHGSGAMNGFSAANGDPVTSTGNLGSGSSSSDPMNGANSMGPAVPF